MDNFDKHAQDLELAFKQAETQYETAKNRFNLHRVRECLARLWVYLYLAGQPQELRSESARMWITKQWNGPGTILSPDKKAGWALSVQILNCCFTGICKLCCYALFESSQPHNCHRKWAYVDTMLIRCSTNPDGEREKAFIAQLVTEAKAAGAIRLLSHGDFKLEHLPAVRLMIDQAPRTIFYGFSRKCQIVETMMGWRLPNLVMHLSIDAERSAPEGFEFTTAYLRTRVDEDAGQSRIAVTFDVHRGQTLLFKSNDARRCRAYDADFKQETGNKPACLYCRRCLQVC